MSVLVGTGTQTCGEGPPVGPLAELDGLTRTVRSLFGFHKYFYPGVISINGPRTCRLSTWGKVGSAVNDLDKSKRTYNSRSNMSSPLTPRVSNSLRGP